ncbi:MAG: T9SS type A sorting domain-containing protein [Bacteroidales bacterium]|nr:T9SS type A sorting domain-containing protein [Bacteroidales bacterium]
MNLIQKLVLLSFLYSALTVEAQYTWDEIILPDSVEVKMIAFDTLGNQFIASNHGVYFSENGYDWAETCLQDYVSYIFINDRSTIYAGMNTLFRSFDYGMTWDSLFFYSQGGMMSFYSIDDSVIILGTWGGIFRSQDSGKSWNHVLDTYNTEVFNDISRDSNGNLFAGSISFDGTLSSGGIYCSSDNGANWELIGLEYHFVSTIEINSADIIYAGTQGHWYNGGGGVFKSIDDGFNWDTIYYNNLVTCITISAFDNVAVGCSSQGVAIGGVFISYDDGLNWEDITNNLPSRDIYKLAFGTDNHLYAITKYDFRLYKTNIPVVINETQKLSNLNHIKVYPNPAHNYIYIQINDENIYSISISDASGKRLYGIKKGNEIIKLDILDMNSGLYFLHFLDENGDNFNCTFIKY